MTTAEVAADSYRRMAERLEQMALAEKTKNRPLSARLLAISAMRCFRAARAEEADTRARA